MTTVHHLNAGTLHAPPYPPAACRCLLLADRAGLALVETGIGLLDVRDPDGRIGRPLIGLAGFQFDEAATAVRLIEAMSKDPAAVRHVVLTHGDPDHTGGLADFPHAQVHLSAAELGELGTGNPRYLPAHFAHGPRWRPAGGPARDWFGLRARPLGLGFESEVLLVDLQGHTRGHAGVAVAREDRWLLHVGDAYYLRVELTADDHPVGALAAARAEDDPARRATLAHLRRLARDHAGEIDLFGYHDFGEFPAGSARPAVTPR